MGPRSCSVVVLAVLCSATGCGGATREAPKGAEAPQSTAASSTPTSVFDEPVVDGSFASGPDGTRLAIRCWGSGSPVVILEGGSGEGGLGRSKRVPVTQAVAGRTEVFAYDRADSSEGSAHPAMRMDSMI